MKENDVAKLASLFKTKPEVLSPLIEEGLSEFIEKFESSHTIMPVADFEKFKENHKASVVNDLMTGEIPKPIYDRVKGTVLEMKEKDLAKRYGVDSFDGYDDLVSKIVESKAKNPDDVNKLKAEIDKLTATHEEKIKGLEKGYNDRFVNLNLNKLINELPIDAEGVKLDNQREIVRTMVRSHFGFNIDGDRMVVTKDGQPITDSKLDPIPPIDVISSYAKDYVNLKSPGSGGRGDGSSTHTSLKSVSISKYLADNKIPVNGFEHAKVLKDFKEKGVEILE